MKWEYRVVSTPVNFGGATLDTDLTRLLNSEGDTGWELVTTHFTSYDNKLTCFYKRPGASK